MKRVLLAVAVLLVLSACNGGGGQSAEPDETATTTVTTTPADATSTVPDVPPTDTRRKPPVPVMSCGVERWAVKTATDPAASTISPTPVDTTIAALDALAAPANPTTRLAPVETTTYRVHANLTLYKMEADSDYHLVLSDHGRTLIAEIPAPACVAASGVDRVAIAQARATFDARFAVNGTQRVSVPVTVEGVGFFDRIHGQAGVAPNGVEVHPVTRITFP